MVKEKTAAAFGHVAVSQRGRSKHRGAVLSCKRFTAGEAVCRLAHSRHVLCAAIRVSKAGSKTLLLIERQSGHLGKVLASEAPATVSVSAPEKMMAASQQLASREESQFFPLFDKTPDTLAVDKRSSLITTF